MQGARPAPCRSSVDGRRLRSHSKSNKVVDRCESELRVNFAGREHVHVLAAIASVVDETRKPAIPPVRCLVRLALLSLA
jgi:hypothetical protein